jgi:hypothetical protein
MDRIFLARPDAGPKESSPPEADGVFALPSGKSKKNLVDPVNPVKWFLNFIAGYGGCFAGGGVGLGGEIMVQEQESVF